MQETHRKWYSHHLGRDIDMLVYGHWGYPVLMFPTSMGRYYEYKDFGFIETVRWFVETGKIKLYCIDSIDRDSWYAKHLHPGTRIWNHVLYDRFLHTELVPGIQRECNERKIGVAGVSFGGYHALNFAFRHPEQVGNLFTIGAAFDIRSFLSGYYDENVYFNNPPDFIPNANNPEFYHMNIVLGSSEYDFCKPSTLNISTILRNKGIHHTLDRMPWGDHDWPVWKEQFPRFMSLI
ncbi:esterase family protein [Spirosoma sp. KUDC1026]|uniref:esterase family protein n=1 Tax=Spirosoma sp. KUDC1026 TaxID=2745947 RepID=UPI00159BD5CF|nr:alpha/beta hydrolase-fold protein [Spirosoma sp. KUDC1026]QKZ13623.1 esterase family protein [Spirosoma sp. KUDC1026]